MEQARRSPIGTRRDAAAALARVLAESPCYGDVTNGPSVNGVRYCGQGTSRAVYVDERSRFVYKVDLSRARNPKYDYSYNEDEYANISTLRGEGVRWAPPAYLWSIDGHSVLAMPFYPTAGYEAPHSIKERAGRLYEGQHGDYLGDLHDDNWRLTKNGQIRVIDLA